jgi:hypothetical protein
MQLLSEVSRPYLVESLTAPIGISHFWSFSGHMMDFKLETMEYLEETTGPTIKIKVQNLHFDIPASWHLLAVDMETYVVDSIPVTSAASFAHRLMLFSPDDAKLVTTTATVVDYQKKGVCVHPTIPKGSAMVHPTGPEMSHGKSIFYGIVCGPHDLHRWVSGRTVGDLLA